MDTYKDGKKTTFAYGSNNLLTSATDIDGYKLAIAYNTTAAGQPNRVSKVSEFDGSVAGGVLNIEYAHNQTTLKDHNGNVQIIQFNNLGNTVAIQDGEGHAQYAKYAKNDADGTGKGNQLIAIFWQIAVLKAGRFGAQPPGQDQLQAADIWAVNRWLLPADG